MNEKCTKRNRLCGRSTPLNTVLGIWRFKSICDSILYFELCDLTDAMIKALYVSRYGRNFQFNPLHELICEKNRPFEILLLRQYLLEKRFTKEVSRVDHRKRLCLHLALKCNYTWETGVRDLHHAENRASETKDEQRLYPFMKAAVNSEVNTTYCLLRSNPTVINRIMLDYNYRIQRRVRHNARRIIIKYKN